MPSATSSSRAVRLQQRDESGRELLARKVKPSVVDVGVASTVYDDLVPGEPLLRQRRSGRHESRATRSGSLRSSCPSRAETIKRRPSGNQSKHIGNDGNFTRTMTSLWPSRSTATTCCFPQSANHRRLSVPTRRLAERETG